MRGSAIVGVIGIRLALSLTPLGVQADDQKAAVSGWHSSMAGNTNESWDAASPYLQNAVAKEKITRQLAAVRNPLGKLVSRDLKSVQPATSLPGHPDGR